MAFAFLAFLLVALLVMAMGIQRASAPLRALGMLLSAVLALASGALALFLVKVGIDNHWRSDGPGILLVMIAIPVCALVSLFFGGLLFALLDVRPPDEAGIGGSRPPFG